jgi:hypothetical protein
MISGAFGLYIMSVAGAVVIAAVAEIIMPEGKTAKYVKSALSVFLVFIIISPLSQMFLQGISFDNLFSSDVLQTDYSFIAGINESKAKALEKSAANYLKQKGYENISVNVLYTGDKEGIKVIGVNIDLTKFEFKDGDRHIHIIDNIIGLVSVYLNVAKENIYIYGKD